MVTKRKEFQKFKVGDEVCWTSSAAGTSKTKEGRVVAVISTTRRYERNNCTAEFLTTHRIQCTGWARDHESYLIEVHPLRGKGKPTLYHPLVGKLQPLFQPVVVGAPRVRRSAS